MSKPHSQPPDAPSAASDPTPKPSPCCCSGRGCHSSRDSQSGMDTYALLPAVLEKVRASGVFKTCAIGAGAQGQMLRCEALASAEPAEYRLLHDGGVWWVALVTENRWLSQSIEQDLVHTGDKMEDLVEEELAELGVERLGVKAKVEKVEHFRSQPPEKLYTFRVKVPMGGGVDGEAEIAAGFLLAMEAAFRRLGDMEADGEDE